MEYRRAESAVLPFQAFQYRTHHPLLLAAFGPANFHPAIAHRLLRLHGRIAAGIIDCGQAETGMQAMQCAEFALDPCVERTFAHL